MRTTSIARVLVVLFFAMASVAGAQGRTLTGVWTRISIRDSVGNSYQPPVPPAFLIFSSNGYFSQSAIPAGRPKTNKPLKDLTRDELFARFQYVDAWRGTYSVKGNELTRNTVADIDPEEENRQVVQVFRFRGDTLILSRANPANKNEARFVRVR